MSKLYRAMHKKTPINARRPRREPTKPVSYKPEDLTSRSPLVAPPDALSWRLAMSAPRQERLAVASLNAAGFAAWYPQETINRLDHRRRLEVTENIPLFKGYIFVGLQGSHTRPIRDCKGVAMLLAPMPSRALVRNLWMRQSAGEFMVKKLASIAIGDSVIATAGAYSELRGIVTRTHDERMSILTTIFGQEREIQVHVDSIKAA